MFNGTYDVEKFIKLAQELELLVIVRAGALLTFWFFCALGALHQYV